MDETRRKQLKDLLDRLGQAIHAAVVDSDEVNACLAELYAGGWEAVMFLEASMLCRPDDEEPVDELRIQVEETLRDARYQLDSSDARWLATLGISPTRHRSQPKRVLPPLEELKPPARDEG